MESTGERGRIQVSESTATLLVHAGKSNWITPRPELVVAKGKGLLQTFWLTIGDQFSLSNGTSTSEQSENESIRSSFVRYNEVTGKTPVMK